MIADRDMNLKDNYFLRKKSPGLDSTRPSSSSSYMFRAAKLRVNLPPDGEETCQSELSMEDDCQRYHWDCSDWANQTTLPAMSELPNGEILEDCSWLSGIQRNSSQGVNQPNRLFNLADPVDPTRDIETLPEDEIETPEQDQDRISQYNSECESQLGAVYPDDESPVHETNKSIEELMMINGVNFADDDEDSVEIPNSYDYKLHLNNYLPTYHLGSDPDTDEATPMLGRHQMARLYQQRSPDSQRYAIPGLAQPPVSQPKNSILPVRGAVLPPTRSIGDEDQVCEIEDAGEENEASAFRRTPSPRVTQV